MTTEQDAPLALTIRIPRALHAALVDIAREEQRSLNAQIVRILRFAAEEHTRETHAGAHQ